MTQVYGSPLSPFVRKVLLTLDIKSVSYEVQPVAPMALPEGYENIHPLKKIPALVDDQITLADSSVICEYLEERYPEPHLRPVDLIDRARGRWFEEFADTKLTEKIGPGVFFQRVVKPAFSQQECDEAIVRTTMEEELPPLFDYLESEVKGAEFLHNKTISLADIALVCPLINLYLAGESIDASRWPKLAAYYDYLAAQPVIAARFRQELTMLGR